MGIYSTRLLESENEELIQSNRDLSDVGNDLEAIEDAIMGDEGIEAHAEEIAAAEEGTVGEELNEAYMAMYESQYNYNQLVRAVGITELSEATVGREVILEAVDIRGFLDKVKDIIKRIWAKIVEMFKKALAFFASKTMTDKKLVEKYSSEIKAGAKTKWEAKGYVYDTNRIVMPSAPKSGEEFLRTVENSLKNIRDGRSNATYGDIDNAKAKIAKSIYGIDVSDPSDSKGNMKAMLKKFRGSDEPVKLNSSNVSGEDVIAILKNENEIKDMKESYKTAKKGFDENLKAIEKIKRDINASDYEDMSNAYNIIERNSALLTYSSNTMAAVFGGLKTLCKQRRGQARKLATKFIVASKGSAKGSDGDKNVNESYGFGFGNVDFI